MSIPKKIHYCWFGNGEKSELVKKCIASWEKFCPDCEIIEWNESNYDVTKNEYMYQAYQAKRWGFVSDYARLDIVYTHGGIYLDTDVELVRNIDILFEENGFIGFESKMKSDQTAYTVNTGQGFGAPAEHGIIKKMRDVYDTLSFVLADGTQNLQPCPFYNTAVLVESGGLIPDNTLQVIDGITVYPAEYFCPVNWVNKKCVITDHTYSIHHFNASWLSAEEKRKREWARHLDDAVHIPNRVLKKVLGTAAYERLKKTLRGTKS